MTGVGEGVRESDTEAASGEVRDAPDLVDRFVARAASDDDVHGRAADGPPDILVAVAAKVKAAFRAALQKNARKFGLGRATPLSVSATARPKALCSLGEPLGRSGAAPAKAGTTYLSII
jgi:hypothetical protein